MISELADQFDAPRSHARHVVDRLRAAGYQAVWAGGCVRDQLLQVTPKDYDVATNARPEQIRNVFGRRRTLAIGAAFGVITVLGSREAGAVEVATFRRDAAYSDGRHPDAVEFCDAEEDARRRDFTINGLFYDPVADQVLDYVGGEADLRRGLIRAIGDPAERIAEDKLRMLRAVRFAATFDFEIQPETMAAVQHHAEQIQVVSAERIGAEIQRMLMLPRRALAARLLEQSGLLHALTGPLRNAQSDKANDQDFSRSWSQALATLDRLPKDQELADELFPAALAAMLQPLAPKPIDVEQQAKQWRLTNQDALSARQALELADNLKRATELPWSRLQPILVANNVTTLLEFAAASAQAGQENQAGVDFCRRQRGLPPNELNPKPLLNGQDLIQEGLPPGPEFRSLLQEVRDLQLDGQLRTRDEALHWLHRRGPALG